MCSALSGMSGAVADHGAACTQCCRWCRLRARSRLHRALPRNRIFFYWESIASLPKSKRLDMLFLCATAIGAAITAEGMSRYMIHYFGHGFQMVAYILFVSWLCVRVGTVRGRNFVISARMTHGLIPHPPDSVRSGW